MFLLREGLCRGNQGGGCRGCHEGRHVGEGGGGLEPLFDEPEEPCSSDVIQKNTGQIEQD